MVTMSSSLLSNPKKVMHVLWLAAGIMVLIAAFQSFKRTSSREWMSNKIHEIVGISRRRTSLKDHVKGAEAAWAKKVKQRHDMIRTDWGTAEKMPLYPGTKGEGYARWPYTVWDFTPATWSCPHEMDRVGRIGDGGKWVCGMTRYEYSSKVRPCIIYSFGVRDESSFENEMLSRTNCELWAYDFSVVDFGVQLEPKNRDRAHFFQAGISGMTDKAKVPPFYTISDLMKMNGHHYIDILKMDIDFIEFEAMDALNRDFPAEYGMELPIGQFMVEIHLTNGVNSAAEYLEWWERLEARGLRATWTEPNLLAVTVNYNKDWMPNMAEYTFLNVYDSRNIIFGGSALTAPL